ncbi:MAG: Bug family tripartite tricarboxylate transporter substrate binding protein [Burkholderiales bacterium]
MKRLLAGVGKRRMEGLFVSLAIASLAGNAQAQTYPAKPVRVIVPFEAGGRVDLAMRIIGKYMAGRWGQAVIVENRPGAGSNTGMAVVASSPPDGYTLASGANPLSANVTLFKNMPFDPVTAFAPITLYYIDANALVVHPSFEVNSVAELIALLKGKPKEYTYASSGNGTSLHLSAELFKSMAGVDVTHVPYRGVPQAMGDLMGGRVTMMFLGLSIATPFITGGKLKGIATTGEKRYSRLPNLPTVAEAGLKGFEASSWAGLLAPAGTPRPVVNAVRDVVVASLNDRETRASLEKYGFELVGNTPEQFAEIIKEEIVKWGAIIRATGAKVD